MKKAIILGLLFVSVSLLVANHNDRKEFKSKFKEYSENNIIPKMNEWKNKIDSELSTEDLEKLNELRAEARKMKTEVKSKMIELKQRKEAGEEVSRKDFKKLMHSNKEEKKAIGDELKKIAEANEELVKEIMEDAKEMRKQWHEDMHEMKKEFRVEMKEKRENEDFERDGEHNRRKHINSKHEKRMEHKGHPVARIFLWDGQVDEDFEQAIPLNIEELNSNDVNSFPNPFEDKATIEFELDRPQKVKVYVLDDTGNIIKTLIDGERSGKVSVEFIPETEANGIYFYKIEGETINKTGKLVLVK